MSRLRVFAVVLAVTVAAMSASSSLRAATEGASPLGISARDPDSLMVKWVPVLLADQRRVFAITKTFLSNPTKVAGVIAATGKLRKDVDAADPAFRSAEIRTDREKRAQSYLEQAAPHFRKAITYWEAFAHNYQAYARQKVEEGAEMPELWKAALAQHDRAEREFNYAWGAIRTANSLLGKPIGSQRTTPPPAPDPTRTTFEIVSVSMQPKTIVANGPHGDISVTWRGAPTFPVTMVLAPDSCPAGFGCATVTSVFATKANPLVWKGATWCRGTFAEPWVMDYSVHLKDSKGSRTQKKKAVTTCQPSG